MLSHMDRVLVALIAKNTPIGDDRVAAIVAEWEAEPNAQDLDLAHYFVEKGHVTRTQMYKLVKARNFALLRKEDKRIARRAVRKGLITRTQVNEALVFQKQLFRALGDIKRIEDILIDDSKLSRDQVNEIWREYREYLARFGEKPVLAQTDPTLLKRQG